jgi:hypothetical protein
LVLLPVIGAGSQLIQYKQTVAIQRQPFAYFLLIFIESDYCEVCFYLFVLKRKYSIKNQLARCLLFLNQHLRTIKDRHGSPG